MNTYRPIIYIISTRRREIILDGFIVASMPQIHTTKACSDNAHDFVQITFVISPCTYNPLTIASTTQLENSRFILAG
ncbi:MULTISPECIES: hypothetical protein [unclassified Vibrio]|uniref:hypothetical protein n=1 Tax=unclassified Vibrio TaxID=2614977 RepID=UPI0012E8E6EB|nr:MULTISPECIES: hypothetical protein [unclassified Vibrio]